MDLLRKLERLLKFVGKRTWLVGSFLYYFRMGKENGYPTCCVLHFSFDRVRDKDILSAVERGGIFDGTPYVYVPCWYHKGRHSHWTPWTGAFTYHPEQLRLF